MTKRSLKFLRRWWLAAVVILSLLVGGTALVIAYPLLAKTQEFARAGQLARQQQCRATPASRRIFVQMHVHGWIGRSDLRLFLSMLPRDC